MENGELDRGVTIGSDEIDFRFQDLHRDAVLTLTLNRTLRVPDDGRIYDLPAGLGDFPMVPVNECRVSDEMKRRGGVVVPLWPAEAAWIRFSSRYPFLVLIAAGKINAVTGASWNDAPDFRQQNYLVVPAQPWLDGFRIDPDTVRQFVAAELGEGKTVEEQLTGEATWGGLQIRVIPMKPAAYWDRIERARVEREIARRVQEEMMKYQLEEDSADNTLYQAAPPKRSPAPRFSMSMGFSAGGKIRQHIEPDPYGRSAWMPDLGLRCFIHMVDARCFSDISNRPCAPSPITAETYRKHGLPWFTHYGSGKTLRSPTILGKLRRPVGLWPD